MNSLKPFVAVFALLGSADALADQDARPTSYIGLGAAYFGLAPASGPASNHFGAALDFRGGIRIGQHAGFNIVGGLALTEWGRTEALFDRGVAVGRWTTGAYGSVTRWADDQYLLIKAFPAFVAYCFLLIPYMVAGSLIALSPLASFTYGLIGPTGSFHFGAPELGGFAEAGVGGMFSLPEGQDRPVMGAGPLVGIGMNLGRWALGARLFWSPRGGNTGLRTGPASVFAGAFTFGIAR